MLVVRKEMFVFAYDECAAGSTGVPTPSVLTVSTLLARLMLRLLALEGARPRSWRFRRTCRGGGFGGAAGMDERAVWWWARREEMADERDKSEERGLLRGTALKGDVEDFAGEELGENSCKGAGGWGRVNMVVSDGGGGLGLFFSDSAGIITRLADFSSLESASTVLDIV